MLNFQAFRRYLSTKGNNTEDLDKVVQLLQTSSTLAEIFSDMKPIQSSEDRRLKDLDQCDKWFEDWKKSL